MFELRMLVPGGPVAVGELQRGPTAFCGQIETQKKTNKSSIRKSETNEKHQKPSA